MITLALETSAKSASVALMRDGTLLAQTVQHAGLTHSTTLLPMIHTLLEGHGITRDDISRIAVAHGPGSFTGIRIGVSTAKGLACALDVPLVGVSSLLAMAHQALHLGDGIICPVMDARRDQVYHARFRAERGELTRLTDDCAIAIADLFATLDSPTPPVFLGDGAGICLTYADANGQAATILPDHLVYQTAWGVAMAAQHMPDACHHTVNPHYIRPPQAERERIEKENMI